MSGKKVVAVVMSDFHARVKPPVCRVDNYFETQKRKLEFISNLAEENNAMLIDAGDLFDSWRSGVPKLECMFMNTLPTRFFSIPGNHEMPGHNINLLSESSWYVLYLAGFIKAVRAGSTFVINSGGVGARIFIAGYPYSKDGAVGIVEKHRGVCDPASMKADIKIAVYHGMVWNTRKPSAQGVEGETIEVILDEFKEYDVVITGHNHETFDCKGGDTILINPGSVMRSSMSQIHHKPCVYKLYSDLSYEKVYIPIESDVDVMNTLGYNVRDDAKADLEQLITNLKESGISPIDFIGNLHRYLHHSDVGDDEREMIKQILEVCRE